jgi:hypothetical protein
MIEGGYIHNGDNLMSIFDKTKIKGTGKKKVNLYPLGLFRKMREENRASRAASRIEPTASDHMVLALQHVHLAIIRLLKPNTKVVSKKSKKR